MAWHRFGLSGIDDRHAEKNGEVQSGTGLPHSKSEVGWLGIALDLDWYGFAEARRRLCLCSDGRRVKVAETGHVLPEVVVGGMWWHGQVESAELARVIVKRSSRVGKPIFGSPERPSYAAKSDAGPCFIGLSRIADTL